MKTFIFFLGIMMGVQFSYAQKGTFSMIVSQDTLLLGNSFEVKYQIENLQGKFENPDLSAFRIVGGPNSSSNMSFVNGTMSQSQSYSYFLEADDIGVYTIMPAYLHIENDVLATEPIDIIVLPNPKGISQTKIKRQKPAFEQEIQLEKSTQTEPKTLSKKKKVRKIF